jgi:hypothetical protein
MLQQLEFKPLYLNELVTSFIKFIPLLNNKNIHLFENFACSRYGQSPLTQLLNIKLQ